MIQVETLNEASEVGHTYFVPSHAYVSNAESPGEAETPEFWVRYRPMLRVVVYVGSPSPDASGGRPPLELED